MESQDTSAQSPPEHSAPQTEHALAATLTALGALLKPYQSEWKRRERLAKFLEQCNRAGLRDDFLQIAELLGQKEAKEVAADPDLPGAGALLSALRAYTDTRIDAYRLQFLDDLKARAAEVELPLDIDFPNLSCRKGIVGTVDFEGRKTTLNNQVLRSIDPRRIVAALQRLDKQLYGRSFDPVAFIDGLFSTYKSMIDVEKGTIGQPVPVRDFYVKHVLSLQSNAFLQDIDKRKFRGYPIDEFSVDLWRFFASDINRTSAGHILSLRPGRNQSLWLLDRDGERRQITNLSFQDAP